MNNYSDMFDKFKQLGLDAKRNAYNQEIIKISIILKSYLKKIDIDSIEEVYNYVSKKDSNLTESELLNISFKNIYIIKEQLLTLLSIIESKDSGDYNG